jgi:hypothetical protein
LGEQKSVNSETTAQDLSVIGPEMGEAVLSSVFRQGKSPTAISGLEMGGAWIFRLCRVGWNRENPAAPRDDIIDIAGSLDTHPINYWHNDRSSWRVSALILRKQQFSSSSAALQIAQQACDASR